MAKQKTRTAAKSSNGNGITAKKLKERVLYHMKFTVGKDWRTCTEQDKLSSLSHAIRDFAIERLIATQQTYYDQDVNRVYYLSMEYLIGRLLANNVVALGLRNATRQALEDLDLNFAELAELEEDAGLGNGGLGRLAACFLDSLASLEYPAYGYGIRYEHGIFKQEFDNGWQREAPDSWLAYGYPWEMVRPERSVPVMVYGRVAEIPGSGGVKRNAWVDWQMFDGVPYDIPIIGYETNTVNFLRLWSSKDSRGFRLDVFNQGEYVKAVEEQNWAETISKVLYPSDHVYAGKELRLIQEYFLVTCSIRDIMRRYQQKHTNWTEFAAKNSIQLNDTHPALAVAELMRFLHDEESLPWDHAWDLTTKTLAYTNHTLMPEALEKWPLELLASVLPRHLQIIFEINRRFLDRVEVQFPGDVERVRRMSLIEEGDSRQVRMANLAMVGSHSINGVAALHTELLRNHVARDFSEMWPEKFNNKTNGITQRRWLLLCNEGLSNAVTERIGDDWVKDLSALKALEPYADDKDFQNEFLDIKRENKNRLAGIIHELTGEMVNTESMFDVQIKRLHEYKRQLLSAMHIIHLYHRIKDNPDIDLVPRTFIFGAKAAPSYDMAKRIIKLINSVGFRVNNDPDVRGRLKVVFLPDYRVSLAEAIIPAADLSEQISTAGHEASGTGNMKLSLNGALTIGTWDGANIEIAEEVGEENIFIFGRRAEEIDEMRNNKSYDPLRYYHENDDLRRVMDDIRTNPFTPDGEDLFGDIHASLMERGDYYFHLADYQDYVDTQARVAEAYRDRREWARKAILNVARMGKFSSDRTIRQYAEEIWNLEHVPIELSNPTPTPPFAEV